ncbi:hypothetical protein G2W53_004399 [Senna tora]|uniref:Uncharacterized protein n=1 Tax=Senna tora TaxID=362788 RepID=A0A835CHZ4_9FABA|nr:hypothetical protein G2W53_004399 [Senna tora]
MPTVIEDRSCRDEQIENMIHDAFGYHPSNERVNPVEEVKMKRLSKKAKSCVDGQPIGRTHLPPQSTSVGASIPNLGTINQLGDSSSLHSPQHDPPTLPTTQDDTSTLPTNHNASTNDQESPKYRKYWVVDVVDEQGLTKETHLRVHDAWGLPPGQRVVVPWNNIGQPIGEGGGLLAIFLGTVAMDFTLFPISYAMWTTMPNVYKNEVYNNTVQAKFVVDDGQHKRFILQSIGKKWRARRGKLYKMYDTSKTREENIANPPLGLTREQWASFIDYRNDPKNQEKSKKNKENRKKQNIPHTGGSKSIARKRAEMEIEKGALVSRGDVWTATHKRRDGSFVNDEARLISVPDEGSGQLSPEVASRSTPSLNND